MGDKMDRIDMLPDDYFEALGGPKPGSPFSVIDDYRFDIVTRELATGSVMDVGAYMGDFLIKMKDQGREIYGTDVNQDRVNFANSKIGIGETVQLGFRNGSLEDVKSDSVDNVVCTEVLEHVPDDRFALRELCRVARKRVIITVPYRENINTVLCVHCSRYTPYSGHLHAYNEATFSEMIPENWKILLQRDFAGPLARRVTSVFRLKRNRRNLTIVKAVDRLSRRNGRWLMVVLQALR